MSDWGFPMLFNIPLKEVVRKTLNTGVWDKFTHNVPNGLSAWAYLGSPYLTNGQSPKPKDIQTIKNIFF